jgi:tRNA threonylcarbamoyladenosine biosynthesis protein TsaE
VDRKYTTNSYKETQELGKILAEEIIKNGLKKRAIVLCLDGNLGGGKTTFLQGFAKGLGINENILSPTFVIMKRFGNFYHIDCYRINKPEEILELGWKEIIKNPKNIVAVEWSEKIKKYLPKDHVKINFNFVDESKREIFFN